MARLHFLTGGSAATREVANPTLKDRLLAWWHGYHLRSAQDDEPEDAGAGSAADANRARTGKPIWTATRIEVAESLWGAGFTGPGAETMVPELVEMLALTSAKSVLDLSAGLGGACQFMAKEKQAWVDGLEANPVLAAAGMQRQTKAGLARKAPIRPFDPETFQWPKSVDVVFARESFFTIADKARLIAVAAAILKPRGQLLFTDFTLDDGIDLTAWRAGEPIEPRPISAAAWQREIKANRLDLRIVDDRTEQYRSLITEALKPFQAHLQAHETDRETLAAVRDEIALWGGRMVALSSGLRLTRFVALKP